MIPTEKKIIIKNLQKEKNIHTCIAGTVAAHASKTSKMQLSESQAKQYITLAI